MTRYRGGPQGPTPGSAADDVPEADQESFARQILLRQLTVAPRTREQLLQALLKRNVPEALAERLLDRFTDNGLINDRDYAEQFIASRQAGGGISRRGAAERLRAKGVPADLIAEAVSAIDEDDEYEAALRLATKKLAGMRGLPAQTRMRRLAGALARRGYGSDLVHRVVRQVEDELDEATAAG